MRLALDELLKFRNPSVHPYTSIFGIKLLAFIPADPNQKNKKELLFLHQCSILHLPVYQGAGLFLVSGCPLLHGFFALLFQTRAGLYERLYMPKKPRYLTGSEIDTILKYLIPGEPLDVSTRLGLFCGLRIGEISNVNRSDIKRALYTGMFHVRKEIAKLHKSRSIPVCKNLAESLGVWYLKHSTVNVRNIVLWKCSMRTVQRRFNDFSKVSGVYFKPHDLRHTFASALYSTCKDLSLVQAALGHEHIKTTLIYVHVDGILQEAIDQAYESFDHLPGRKTYRDKLK